MLSLDTLTETCKEILKCELTATCTALATVQVSFHGLKRGGNGKVVMSDITLWMCDSCADHYRPLADGKFITIGSRCDA